jgi:hypothetical protein
MKQMLGWHSILVRQVFQTQVGRSKEVATMIMQGAAQFSRIAPDVHGRVLTDLSGPFGTVVLEIEVESLAEWERVQAALAADDDKQPAGSPGGAPSFTGGYQEFYTLEGTF